MARANRTHGSAKPRPASRKANAAGYAKRQSRKAKNVAGLSDVYEYEQQKTKRSRTSVSTRLDREEALEYGINEDGEDDEGGGDDFSRAVKWKLLNERDDDGGLDPDDDEDIDSDEAFEESDEERFAGFSFASSKAKKPKNKKDSKAKQSAVRFAEIDLNEDSDEDVDARQSDAESGSENEEEEEEEEEEGDDDEFINVLDVLDGKGDPNVASETGSVEHEGDADDAGMKVGDDESDMADEVEDEEDEEDEDENDDQEMAQDDEDAFAPSGSEDEGNPEALDNLSRFISNLEPSHKRKASDDADERNASNASESIRPNKRRHLKERTAAGMENEFGVSSGDNKLKLDDFLAPLASQSSNLLSLKKSTKPLASSRGALDAPLPTRTQERLDREAAYEQTKEEVEKWKETMKRIKEAEHLSFPLQAQPQGKVSNLELTAKFKPTTQLESSVDALLKSANLRDDADIQQTESLKLNHLSIEEVAARRAELRQMRELMFRAEVKAKRVAKIKSKTYRKLKKGERVKLMAKLDGADESGDEMDEEQRMKREVERARERATLRHKNTGKWAKAMKNRNELDEDQRAEMLEMLDRGEKLRRKIRGEKGSDEESESDGDSGADDIDGIKAGAFEEVAQLRRYASEDGEEDEHTKHKSVLNMKFMRDAMARDQQRAEQMADDFLNELGSGNGGDGDDEIVKGDGDESSGVAVQRTGGRIQYRPGANTSGQAILWTFPSLASDTSSVTLKSTDLPSVSPIVESDSSRRPLASYSATALKDDQSNPWLVSGDSSSKAPRKKNEVVVSKESASADKSKNRLKKRMKNLQEEREKAQDDAVVEISMNYVLTMDDAEKSKENEKSRRPVVSAPGSKSTEVPVGDDDSDAHSEIDEQERALDKKGKGKGKGNGVKAFQQKDLVALAFAGDNVVQDFEIAKRREVEEDAPREVDTTLPGWGSWGGRGMKKQGPKPHLIKKVAGIDPKSRADYNKSHVIISEKRDKKAAKYMVKDLPHPYTSKAQYERSLETPLGTEWNTRLGFQRGTLPKVVKKMGTVINPLEKAGRA